MLKTKEELARLAFVGEGAQIFAGALLLRPERISVGEGSRIDDFTRIEGGEGIEIGRFVHISSFCSIFAGGRARIGDYACMAQGSRILTGSERLDAAMSSVAPADWRSVDRRPVILDHLSFIGANAVVLPGCTIGLGAVVAAGAVTTGDVPPWEVWAGVPARFLKRRDPQSLHARGIPIDELERRSLALAEPEHDRR